MQTVFGDKNGCCLRHKGRKHENKYKTHGHVRHDGGP